MSTKNKKSKIIFINSFKGGLGKPRWHWQNALMVCSKQKKKKHIAG